MIVYRIRDGGVNIRNMKSAKRDNVFTASTVRHFESYDSFWCINILSWRKC